MNNLDFIKFVCTWLDDKKGEDIVALNIEEISSIADYFIIVSSSSERGVKSLADNLITDIKKKFQLNLKTEGANDKRWIIIDSGDVLIHIFHSETRAIYDLESLWYDAKKVSAI